MKRLGVLSPESAEDRDEKSRLGAFLQELERLRWSPERNVYIEYLFVPIEIA
jgi:hypothetical protein